MRKFRIHLLLLILVALPINICAQDIPLRKPPQEFRPATATPVPTRSGNTTVTPSNTQNTGADLFNLAYDLNKRCSYIYTQKVMREKGFRLIEKHMEGSDFQYLYVNANKDTISIGDYGSVGFGLFLTISSEKIGKQAMERALAMGFTDEDNTGYMYSDGHCCIWTFGSCGYWMYGRDENPAESNDIMTARYAIDYCEDKDDWDAENPDLMFYQYYYEYAGKDRQNYYYWSLGCKLTRDFKPTAFKKQTSSVVKANRGRNREISIRFFNTTVANNYAEELKALGYSGRVSDKYEDVMIYESLYSPFHVYLVTDKGSGHQHLGGYYLIVSRTAKDL